MSSNRSLDDEIHALRAAVLRRELAKRGALLSQIEVARLVVTKKDEDIVEDSVAPAGTGLNVLSPAWLTRLVRSLSLSRNQGE